MMIQSIFMIFPTQVPAGQCYVILTDMMKLRSTSDVKTYDEFVNQGYFTIRRSSKFWSGVWSDVAIEQVLMRGMKCMGGLTRGRGVSESTVTKWIACAILLLEISHEMEQFCNYTYENTEHVDSRSYRMNRDATDLVLLIDFYKYNNLFLVSDKLYSICSGIVGNHKISYCHKAHKVGINLVNRIIGIPFEDVKFKRKDQVLLISAMNNKIKVNDAIVTIQPLSIYQRICLKSAKLDVQQYLMYELAPYPLALFNMDVMRKTEKSVFTQNFIHSIECPFHSPFINIVDGGYLLYQVIWKINESMDQILNKYINYAKNNFTKNSMIIFDGYSNVNDTKCAERLRR
ncbi:uncharacterized protein LOC108737016 isoform X1 [Agrilus planipennis]|uniref:Uncharacterized protein LOC108737016 isoform X1 n=1 Tax=Agrilus planipennis TaxID=224129 RepID=A0A7F5RKE5_AGRPL|nr:uncharacterized protein LOC108737016 isoform X1 [Agrilus planipennis]